MQRGGFLCSLGVFMQSRVAVPVVFETAELIVTSPAQSRIIPVTALAEHAAIA